MPVIGRQFSAPLFHGTQADFAPGSHVLPAVKAGVKSHWGDTGSVHGQPSREHAFATTSEPTAWVFATGQGPGGGGRGRARVYSVDPHPEMREGHHKDLKEYIAPSFRVQHSIDIAPGQQGTFPQVNWWDHATPKHYGDPNHPRFNNSIYERTPDGSSILRTVADNSRAKRSQDDFTLASRNAPQHPGQGELFNAERYQRETTSPGAALARHHLRRAAAIAGLVQRADTLSSEDLRHNQTWRDQAATGELPSWGTRRASSFSLSG